jgi:hypothetical protein
MPNYKGHLAGGAVTFAGIIALTKLYRYPWLKLSEWLVFTLGGALFPDVDIKSKGQKIFYRLLLVMLIYLLIQQRLQAVIFLGITGAVPQVVRHRGIFHHPWFIILCSVAPVFVASMYQPYYFNLILGDSLFFCAGAFSHLILDRGITKVGKQLLFL